MTTRSASSTVMAVSHALSDPPSIETCASAAFTQANAAVILRLGLRLDALVGARTCAHLQEAQRCLNIGLDGTRDRIWSSGSARMLGYLAGAGPSTHSTVRRWGCACPSAPVCARIGSRDQRRLACLLPARVGGV